MTYYLRISLSVIVLFLLSVSAALAQRRDSSYHAMDSLSANLSASHLIWHDMKEGVYDGEQFVARPFHWTPDEWFMVGATAGVTYASERLADQPVRDLVKRNHSDFASRLASFGNQFYGNGIASGVAAVSLYSIGLAANNSRLRLMGRDVVASFIYAGLTTTLLKYVLGRERPYLGDGPNAFHWISLNDAWNSLPSGHCTVASALSETLAADIDRPWAYATFYTFEAATVFGRIYADRHWLSDTFLGLVIGNLTGYWVTHQPEHYGIATNKPESTSFVIMPTMNGISLAYRF